VNSFFVAKLIANVPLEGWVLLNAKLIAFDYIVVAKKWIPQFYNGLLMTLLTLRFHVKNSLKLVLLYTSKSPKLLSNWFFYCFVLHLYTEAVM
jgi:hypothetical protein